MDLGSSKTMEGSQEAINILVSLTVISAFISVNTDSDVLSLYLYLLTYYIYACVNVLLPGVQFCDEKIILWLPTRLWKR